MARTNKSYDKETFVERVKEYIELRNLGYSIEEIEEVFLEQYQIKNIDSYRKAADLLNNVGAVEVKIDSEIGLKKLAKAKAHILTDRKINIQANKELHSQANDNARWEFISNKLKEWKPVEHTMEPSLKIYQPTAKDVIYIVGDVHYRGEIDDGLVKGVFAQIKSEIEGRNYEDVTLILTGDNVDGEIHNEQQRTNEPVMDATMRLLNLYVDLINQIPNITKIFMVYGNHEEIRLWGDKGTTNNVGKFIYWGLKNCLKYADVYTELDKDGKPIGGEVMFYYKNKSVVLLHGHQNYAKNKARLIEHFAVKYNKQPDYIILGHFHTSKANQFSRNHWLITAPALKDWESNWDSNNGYCGLGQYIKLKLNFDTPQITTLNVGVR